MTATYDSYLQSDVLNAEPIELVLFLYREAIKSCISACGCVARGDIRGRSASIAKVSAIVTELALSVDHAKAPAIGRGLVEIYDYLQFRLHEANTRQIEEPLQDVRRLLESLLDAWERCATLVAARPMELSAPAVDHTY
jgi:flagellar protein FliS